MKIAGKFPSTRLRRVRKTGWIRRLVSENSLSVDDLVLPIFIREGNNVRGVYWTIADESGKEVSRDVPIDESKYTQLVPEFENTYFNEVYKTLSNKFKLGRVRLLLKEPRSTLSWHKDPEPRLHIPIITNLGCSMVIENVAKHLPADGHVTITNNTKYHNFFNGGEQSRVHLVACVLENPFQ